MKHKTLKRVLCFLLALVVVASMPLDIHANAVAVAPWAVYALITYMAAVGITFTVSGGVDAMVKAVQDKVDEYEKTVSLPLPIWVVIEEGTKLVPPPSGGGPNWNPNRGKFFFTANATAAITAFITWLVSDGGWNKGGAVESEFNEILFVTNNSTSILSDSRAGYYPTESIYKLGDTFTLEEFLGMQVLTEQGVMTFAQGSSSYDLDIYIDGVKVYTSSLPYKLETYAPITFCIHQNYTTPSDIVLICGKVTESSGTSYPYTGQIMFNANISFGDGSELLLNYVYTDIASSVDIMTPEEIPQLQPSTQQGVYIDTSTDAETLEELAEDIKTQFEETGTIPRPVPEVITDPDVVPEPSPVPTPPVYEDVDGLGLPSLAETMKNKFPFCLPYDLGRVFEIFYAEPVAPYWEVDLFATLGNRVPFVGDTSFTIDLAEYEELGTISRWMTTIGYTLLLILITRQTIKW